MANILAGLPNAQSAEVFETLARGKDVLIERIVSRGQRSAEDYWYEQPHEEWVMVMQGQAVLRWDDGSSLNLRVGDWVTIPAGKRHRVEWTDPQIDTVWLAVHYPSGA